ncbi:MAG: hypothetical protein WC758_02460 [Candidatus Woesearchaeota archaeon]|jgi:hypothetical protein
MVNKKNIKSSKKAPVGIPTGVKVIAILEYIGAGLSALFGLALIFGAGAVVSMFGEGFGALGSALLIGAGIFMIGIAVLAFFIARGLWHAKNWARILLIVLSCLGVLMTLISLFSGEIVQGLLGIIVNGVIGGYLLFSNEVKTAFA